MKFVLVAVLFVCLLFVVGCDTNLVEDHDHDGDGIADHSAEEHMQEDHDEDNHMEEEHMNESDYDEDNEE